MKINGFNKTTLLDYPQHLAATIFLGACNFRCPFCHNKGLVLNPANEPFIDETEVLDYLEKRRGVLEGVCITGGEPTLHLELEDFIRKIKKLDLKVKLDTNGYRPEVLKDLYEKGLIDYVAMDIKSDKKNYKKVSGIDNLDIERIIESVDYIMSNVKEYEFRTTVVKQLHTFEDLCNIAEWIKGCKKYRLQSYRDTQSVIQPGFEAYSENEMLTMNKKVQEIINI